MQWIARVIDEIGVLGTLGRRRKLPGLLLQAGGAMNGAELLSVLTCPHCGHAKREQMPSDACQFFYQCEGCHRLLRPRPGDCCVFCSYGSVKCPPMQLQAAGMACGCSPTSGQR